MHNRTVIASLVLGAFALAGCAGPSPVRVEPTVRVTHGGTGPEAILEAGRSLLAERRYAAAVDVYRGLLRANPNLVDARSGLGVAYAGLGQHAAATEAFEAAIQVAPDKPYLYNNLGYALMLEGAHREAIAILQLAEGLDPQDRKVQENLAAARARLATTVTTLPADAEAGGDAQEGGRTSSAPDQTRRQAPGGPVLEGPAAQAEFVPVSPSILVLRRSDRVRAAGLPALQGAAPMPAGAGPTVGTAGAAGPVDALRGGRPQAPAEAPRDRQAVSAKAPAPAGAPAAEPVKSVLPAALHSLKSAPAELGGVSILASGGRFGIEVSNGNGTAGLAHRTAALLKAQGLAQPTRLTNHTSFRQGKTEIQYREGFRAAAEDLQKRLGGIPSVLLQSGSLRPGTDVRLLLGQDFGDRPVKLARAG